MTTQLFDADQVRIHANGVNIDFGGARIFECFVRVKIDLLHWILI